MRRGDCSGVTINDVVYILGGPTSIQPAVCGRSYQHNLSLFLLCMAERDPQSDFLCELYLLLPRLGARGHALLLFITLTYYAYLLLLLMLPSAALWHGALVSLVMAFAWARFPLGSVILSIGAV